MAFLRKKCYFYFMKTKDIPNRDKLINVMRQNEIEFAALFGSRAKDNAQSGSDYDILIQFTPNARVGLFKYQEIEDKIAETLGEKVDLVTVNGIDKYIKEEVFQTMKVIYGKRPEK